MTVYSTDAKEMLPNVRNRSTSCTTRAIQVQAAATTAPAKTAAAAVSSTTSNRTITTATAGTGTAENGIAEVHGHEDAVPGLAEEKVGAAIVLQDFHCVVRGVSKGVRLGVALQTKKGFNTRM